MGCWNETCGFSQHSILAGERVYSVIILGNPTSDKSCYANGVAKPMSLIIEGLYNDYGSIEDIDGTFAATMLIQTFNSLLLEKKLIITSEANDDIESNIVNKYGVTGYTEENGFEDCETILYFIERGYLYIEDYDYKAEKHKYPIFFMMFKKEIIDIAIDVIDSRSDYSYINITKENMRSDVATLYTSIFSNDKSDRYSFSFWGGDELNSENCSYNNLRFLRSLEHVDTNTFRKIYLELYNKNDKYDSDDVIYHIGKFLMFLHTFDAFRKIWAPQGHSTQDDNFDIELKFTERLLRYIYEQQNDRISTGWYDDTDQILPIGGISVIKNEDLK